MAVESSVTTQSLAGSEDCPAKRPRMMNTPPAEADEADEIDNLLNGSVKIEADWMSGNESLLTASWERLLHQIREEIRVVTNTGSDIIPVIDFEDISFKDKADLFFRDLAVRGAAIIRNVISLDEAATWSYELDSYLRDNPHTKASPPENPELYELFWSLAQLKARAHPNMLVAQKFAMSGCWRHKSKTSRGKLSCNFPVTYADRVRMLHKSLRGSSPGYCRVEPSVPISAQVGGGGERKWAEDGHGAHSAMATYRKIWTGDWEDYDPWDSSTHLEMITDFSDYSSTPSVFRMFQGILPLSLGSSEDDPPFQLCSLPLKVTTAYWLLRSIFSPKRPCLGNKQDFLDPSNWILDTAQSLADHARRSPLSREINDTLHPHLLLEKTLVSLPSLNPGDYVIWHPDTIYSTRSARPELHMPSSTPFETSCCPATRPIPPSPSTLLYTPACPLTQSNVQYLVHQRKAFLLGFPGPDFTSISWSGRADIGESYHMGRPGVQEISDAGGEEALRAMGLLAWEEDDDAAADADERGLLKMANAVLFTD